jgi:hypothetical protein
MGELATLRSRDMGSPVARLAELRAAGLVRHASEQAEALERSLPVAAPLRSLLPEGLRRGGTVAMACSPGSAPSSGALPAGSPPKGASSLGPVASGSTSLLFALLAEASAAGSWSAVIGLPRLGLVAAAEAGVAMERFALVPNPGQDWPSVVAALLDGVDIVVAALPEPVPAQVASRLTARARQRGAVLMPVGRWPGADITLEVTGAAWHGLGQGRGRLHRREMDVVAYGRGAAARPRHARLWLPSAPGSVPIASAPIASAPSVVRAVSGAPPAAPPVSLPTAPPVPLLTWDTVPADTVPALELAG